MVLSMVPRRWRLAAVWCGIVAALVFGGYWLYLVHGLLFPPAPDKAREDSQLVRYILPQEPVTKFPVKPVRETPKALDPSELVLAVTIAGEARAYPVNVLNEIPARKVLNDTLGGRPIAATW